MYDKTFKYQDYDGSFTAIADMTILGETYYWSLFCTVRMKTI